MIKKNGRQQYRLNLISKFSCKLVMKTTTLVLLLLSYLLNCSHAFVWDTFNVERLFKDSETFFPWLRQKLPADQSTCLTQFENFVNQLKQERTWAITQLGTWGKMPAGLKWGNDVDYGHFDECLSFRADDQHPHDPQHCQLPVTENSGRYGNVTFRMGLCVPDTCSSESVMKVMTPFFANVNYKTQTIDPEWCTTGEKPAFGTIQWIVGSILIVFAVLLISSTAYEVYLVYLDRKPNPLLASFSMYQNANRLFQQRGTQGTIECLNGIRVLSTCWIILLHCFRSYDWFVPAMYNRIHVEEFKTTWGWAFMEHGDLSVDTFLMMGGMLICYNFMQAREKKVPFNILKYYLHRYIRLAPVFLAGMMILIAFTKYLGDGPAWYVTEPTLEAKCRKYWWSSILMIQNYVNPFSEVWLFCALYNTLSTHRPVVPQLCDFCTFFPVHRAQLVHFSGLSALRPFTLDSVSFVQVGLQSVPGCNCCSSSLLHLHPCKMCSKGIALLLSGHLLVVQTILSDPLQIWSLVSRSFVWLLLV